MGTLFLTRDWDATLKLHFEKPTLFQEDIWISHGEKELDFTLFPEVTFENSPQEVELTLCNHINTVKIQDHNPKKQTCVLTNHGIITDVIFK